MSDTPTNGNGEYAAHAACGCCGRDATRKRLPDPWEGRLDGYCDECALTRCDAYPGDCPVVDTITELDRIDVLAMILQGRDGDHPTEFWRSRAHRLLNHREPLLTVLGIVEVQGAETCLTHVDGVLLETGSGVCDMSNDSEECRGGR